LSDFAPFPPPHLENSSPERLEVLRNSEKQLGFCGVDWDFWRFEEGATWGM